MRTTEEQIRDLLVIEEERAPLAVDAMPRLQRGIVRSRQRRVGAVAAAAIAVTAAITVPVVVHQDRTRSGSGTQGATTPPPAHRPARIGLATYTTLAPTWLPAGLRETSRAGQIRAAGTGSAYGARSYGETGHAEVWVTDLHAPMDVRGGKTEPVRVAGRTGVGWALPDQHGYRIQVKWRAGHWLYLTVVHVSAAKTTALRVANSVVERDAVVGIPLTCSRCSTINGIVVSGSRSKPFVEGLGGALLVTVDTTAKPNDRLTKALGHGLYAHFGSLAEAKHKYSQAEYVAIAKSARLVAAPDFSWMGTRP